MLYFCCYFWKLSEFLSLSVQLNEWENIYGKSTRRWTIHVFIEATMSFKYLDSAALICPAVLRYKISIPTTNKNHFMSVIEYVVQKSTINFLPFMSVLFMHEWRK